MLQSPSPSLGEGFRVRADLGQHERIFDQLKMDDSRPIASKIERSELRFA
jgi:hypothetical protein